MRAYLPSCSGRRLSPLLPTETNTLRYVPFPIFFPHHHNSRVTHIQRASIKHAIEISREAITPEIIQSIIPPNGANGPFGRLPIQHPEPTAPIIAYPKELIMPILAHLNHPPHPLLPAPPIGAFGRITSAQYRQPATFFSTGAAELSARITRCAQEYMVGMLRGDYKSALAAVVVLEDDVKRLRDLCGRVLMAEGEVARNAM